MDETNMVHKYVYLYWISFEGGKRELLPTELKRIFSTFYKCFVGMCIMDMVECDDWSRLSETRFRDV